MSDTSDFRKYLYILEAHDKAYRIDLPYTLDSLSPVLSKDALQLHYGKLHKGYVDRALEGIDYEWNIAGAELHNLFFAQFQAPKTPNNPHNSIKQLIEDEWGNYNDFKDSFTEEALGIKGSGWCYLSTSGNIRTISNHKSSKGIALILDMWEHAYVLDYGSDKQKYIDNFWKIINWDIVSARIES